MQQKCNTENHYRHNQLNYIGFINLSSQSSIGATDSRSESV